MRIGGAGAFAALMLGGCTASHVDPGPADAIELAEALAGRTAGPARRCIDPGTANGPRVIGESLAYRAGRTLWVSDAVGGCPSLRGDPITVVEMYGGQLCANDRFRTIPRGGAIAGPYCRFGPFIPWVKPS